MKKLEKVLQKYDFTTKEIEFYLAILKIGRGNAAEIARTAKMDKSTAYRAADGLLAKGLLTRNGDEYDEQLLPEPPEKIIELLQNKKKDIQKDIRKATRFIEEIQTNDNLRNAGLVKIYEGDDAFLKIKGDRLNENIEFTREIYSSQRNNPLPRPSANWWKKYLEKRLELGIVVRMLMDETADTKDTVNFTNKKMLKEVRMIPSGYTLPSGMSIYGNKVSFENSENFKPIMMIIEDTSIAGLMSTFFDIVWANSKTVHCS
jgi:sugar-specific transcriptional regulator TrmB